MQISSSGGATASEAVGIVRNVGCMPGGVLNRADNLKRSLERKKTHDYLNKCCFTDYFESIEHPLPKILRNSAVTEFLDLTEEGG